MKGMSEEDLRQWHDTTIERCIQLLRDEGSFVPMAFVLTSKMDIGDDVRSFLRDITSWAPIRDDGSNPTEQIFLTVPLDYLNPDILFFYIRHTVSDPERFDKEFEQIIKATGETRDHARIMAVKIMQEQMNMSGKDLCALFLRNLCGRVDAKAISKFDETWYLKRPNLTQETLPKTLEHEPDRLEALMSTLETPGLIRTALIPFTRDVIDTGKITNIESAQINERKLLQPNGKPAFGGRFIGLLPQNYETLMAAKKAENQDRPSA